MARTPIKANADWLRKIEFIATKRAATETALAACEKELGIKLPADLRTLLVVSDGVEDKYGGDVVWSAADIAKSNAKYRTSDVFRDLYMPFDHLLLLGELGNGDVAAFAIMRDGKVKPGRGVYRWDHETDARVWMANSLEQYVVKVASGQLE